MNSTDNSRLGYDRVSNLTWLVDTYFSNPERRTVLKPGEILIHENEPNRRLFFILRGAVRGFVTTPDDLKIQIFRASENMFVGVYSFFARSSASRATVMAEEETEVAFIDQDQEAVPDGYSHCLFEQFMPAMIEELYRRDQWAVLMAEEKEEALRQLMQSQKMASLGQMAAGISHELNNAISVIARNTDWLSTQLSGLLAAGNPDVALFFKIGLQDGRKLSSREIRKRAREIEKTFSIPSRLAKTLARTGMADETLKHLAPRLQSHDETIGFNWEIGATLKDMQIAADHVAYVIQSVKDLGVPRSAREPGLDVNETIREALSLLRSALRPVKVTTKLEDLPAIQASRGELIQVWTNLVKNAVDSLVQSGTEEPGITVKTSFSRGSITILVHDNGPGIAADILPHIFQPDVTTKVGGLSFGLGLGLPICERVVQSYGGTIDVTSVPGDTLFTVIIPARQGENQT